jgi:hypothetical protein
MKVITKIKTYTFDVSKAEEAAEYQLLKDSLKNKGLKCFATYSSSTNNDHKLHGLLSKLDIVTLDTNYIFNDQWNTPPLSIDDKTGWRVHDWEEPIYNNKNIKKGYYLKITQEIQELRDNTLSCGYCGRQYPAATGMIFCTCLGSEHLTLEHIHLLKLAPISFKGIRSKLTKTEEDILVPLYKNAQIYGNDARSKKRIADLRLSLVTDRDKAILAANTEHDGMVWLLNRGINTNNVIYYKHTDTFCFGWRQTINADIKAELQELLVDYPFKYEFK